MPHHVVVDGSNLATEGRAMPSLAQLQDAVMAFIDEHPEALITVVVDATFGHRIDASEVKEFDAAVANNEVVAPPAGAIGRGDAFLLSIANKVGATVLSNDSFQEFHGTYTWLFDEGRLIGGKPVPHIGWVFVARVPVRGQISRTAVKEAKRKKPGPLALALPAKTGKRQTSPEASRPMPVPKAPPPNATVRGAHVPAAAAASAPAAAAPAAASGSAGASTASTKATSVNELMPFLSFVELHPIGTIVNATVESYSSHGAYVRLVGDVVGYVPLRMMADPAPRSAREFLTLGDAVTLVVESFAPTRRSIDLATVAMATAKPPVPRKPTARAAKEAAKRAAQELAEAVAADGATADAPVAPTDAAAVVDGVPGAGKATRGRRGGARRGKGGAPTEAATDTSAAPEMAETPAPAPVEAATEPTAAVAPKKRAKKAPAAAQVTPAAPPPAAEPAAVAPRKRAAKQAPRAAAAAAPAPPPSEPVVTAAPAKAAPVAKKARAAKKAPAAPASPPAAPAEVAAPAKAPRRRRVAD